MREFLKVGRYFINVGLITHVEVYESGESIKVSFSGSDELRLDPIESRTLLSVLQQTPPR